LAAGAETTLSVARSIVEGGFAGDFILDADPRFVDRLGPDLVAGTSDDDLRLRLQGLHHCRALHRQRTEELGIVPLPDLLQVVAGAKDPLTNARQHDGADVFALGQPVEMAVQGLDGA